MSMRPLIITLDGPAGAGKTSVGEHLAKRLGLEFLDTGAMYRGLTAQCLDEGIDPATNPEVVVKLAERTRWWFDWTGDPPRLHSDARDLTDRLRDPDTTGAVSAVAQISAVRQILVAVQRQIGSEHPRLVAEGRDQGSVVFPNAHVKFYLEASPAVRARRRAQQLGEAGRPVDESHILQQIIDRDTRDNTRSDGPLICPVGAVRIDTSPMSFTEVVDRLERHVVERANPRPDAAASKPAADIC